LKKKKEDDKQKEEEKGGGGERRRRRRKMRRTRTRPRARTRSTGITFIHSFHWHVQNATIPCRSQQLLPSLSATHVYPFLPPFSTN
jgi:hypothetical protein